MALAERFALLSPAEIGIALRAPFSYGLHLSHVGQAGEVS